MGILLDQNDYHVNVHLGVFSNVWFKLSSKWLYNKFFLWIFHLMNIILTKIIDYY